MGLLDGFRRLLGVGAERPDTASLYRAAKTNLINEKYEAALEGFSRLIEHDSRNADGWYGRAQAKMGLSQRAEALADAAKAVELAPQRPEYRLTLSQLQREAKENAAALHQRGVARAKDGDFAGAITDLDAAIAADPSSEWFVDRGRVRAQRGDVAGALEDFTRAIAQGGGSSAHLARAYFHEDRGEFAPALADFKRAAELESEVAARVWPLTRCAEVHLKCGAIDDGIAGYSDILRQLPHRYDVLYRRADARHLKLDLQGANDDFTACLRLAPDGEYAYAYFWRGVVRQDLRLWAEALADFRAYGEREPAKKHAAVLRSWLIRAGLGEREGASRDLEALPPAEWESVIAEYLLGRRTEQRLLEAAASDEGQRAVRTSKAHFYIGMKLRVDGGLTGAVERLRACVETAGGKDLLEVRSARAALRDLGT
jgi:tetratricopeptide (TPR) repeat protein